MSRKEAITSRIDYVAFADIVAAAGILVVASRPDGLAITASAAIVAAAAVICRAWVSATRYVAGKARRPAAPGDVDRQFRPPPKAEPAPPPVPGRSRSRSWLRDDG